MKDNYIKKMKCCKIPYECCKLPYNIHVPYCKFFSTPVCGYA